MTVWKNGDIAHFARAKVKCAMSPFFFRKNQDPSVLQRRSFEESHDGLSRNFSRILEWRPPWVCARKKDRHPPAEPVPEEKGLA